MAIAAWRGMGSSYGSDASGVLAFYQPVVDYTTITPPTPPNLTAAQGPGGTPGGFNTTDLILVPIPEPSSLALAGLGTAALLIFLRRN